MEPSTGMNSCFHSNRIAYDRAHNVVKTTGIPYSVWFERKRKNISPSIIAYSARNFFFHIILILCKNEETAEPAACIPVATKNGSHSGTNEIHVPKTDKFN